MNSLGRRASSLSLSRIAAAAVQAVALIVVARFVDVSTFGELSVIVAVVSFVFIIAAAGLPTFVLRERALGDDAAVRTALRANVITSVGGLLLLTGAILLFAPAELAPWAIAVAGAVALDKNVDCQISVALADKRMDAVTVSIAGRAAVMAAAFAAILVATAGDQPLLAYAGARAASAVFGVAHALLVRTRFDVAVMGFAPFGRIIWPLAASNSISAVRTLDSLVVFVAGGSAIAGLYSAATRPFAPAGIVAGAVSAVLMPHAATAPPSALTAPLRRLGRTTILLSIALVPVAFLGPLLAVLIYGESYREAGVALGVSLVVVPSMISAAVMATVLQSRGEERFVVSNGLVFLPIFVAFVALGAVWGGATGAAMGMALSVWGRNLGLAWGIRRMVGGEGTRRE